MRLGFVTSLIVSLSCWVNHSLPQRLQFKNYSVSDGLVANHVKRIFQDSKGFLWIGTWEGLSKYDGHRFKNYTTTDGLTGSLINDLYESPDGTIYVVTNSGSLDAIHTNGVAQQVVQTKTIINRFLHLQSGKIIITTDNNGLQEFRDNKLVTPLQKFPRNNYFNITRLNDSLFVAGSDSSVQVLTNDCELWAEIREPYPAFTECAIYVDSKKRIWIGRYGAGFQLLSLSGVNKNRISPLNPPAILPFLQKSHVNAFFEDNTGNIWIGTTTGLVKISPDGSTQVITSKNGLISDNVTSIFQDHDSNIWFGTSLGISKLVTKSNIRIYTTGDGLSSNEIHMTYPVKRNILLSATQKGIQLFNTGTSRFTSFDKGSIGSIFNYTRQANRPLFYSSNELVPFDTTTLVLNTHSATRFTGPGYYIFAANRDGSFFMTDHAHLYFSTGKKEQIDTILSFGATCLLIDQHDHLWAGTWDSGLFRFKYVVEGNKIKILSTHHLLPDKKIRSLYQDSKGNMWVGTRYHGAYLYKNDAQPRLLMNIDQSLGLTSNFTKSIREDKHGNIWLAFVQGLDKLVIKDTGYQVFNFSKINNFFTTINAMEFDLENVLWLATAEGMVKINDGEMEKLAPLPVFITRISSPDSTYPANTSRLELGYKHNQLQFEFSSPGFINEKQLVYSYRLAGGNSAEWSQPSGEHTVSYANLQPGNYRFEVRNKGWNGEWGAATTFEFVIYPPFWQTWWFITIVAATAAAIIFWVVRRRIKSIRKESELKQKIAETEMMALRAQMNPHFIFNCLNAIDNLVQTNQKEKATTYLARFAKLIRSVLDSSKNNVVPFQNDYESLRLYLQMEQFRCNNKFSYELTAVDELLHSDYKVPPLIVQPFVENAIHHGLMNKQVPDRKLSVSALIEDDHIVYTVADNGVGRERAAAIKELNKPDHQSYGMAITRERIHLYNQNTKAKDIVITDISENGQPAGTRVEIRLKIAEHK